MTLIYTLTPRAALSGVLPADQIEGAVASREVLIGMLERLNLVGDSGWAAYPILPSTVSAPQLAILQDYVSGEVANYILWPAVEYATWQAAWAHLVHVLGAFGAEFPLGNSAEIRAAVQNEDGASLRSFPTAAQAASNLVSFLLWMQRTYENIPKHPRVGVDKPGNGDKTKLGISPWTIVGVVTAAVVGGAVLYAHKHHRWPFDEETTI